MYQKIIEGYKLALEIEKDSKKRKFYQDLIEGYVIASELENKVVSKKGTLLAPNGKPSNLTPEQYKLVRKPAFKQWFGDWEKDPANASKVVDENGEPMVCYHGTNTDFNVFKIGRTGGLFFTNKKETAYRFSDGDLKREGISPKVLECFLKINNLYDKNTNDEILVDNYYQDFFKNRPFIKKQSQKNILKDKFNKYFMDLVSFGIVNDKPKLFLLKYNYNGIVIDANNNSKSYIVFNSNQIKLADGSNTTFDTGNPDIRFNDGGRIENEFSIIIKGVTNENKYKGNYKKIFDLIEKDLAFYNPYGTSFEKLIGNNFYITITPKPESSIIDKISKLQGVEIVDSHIRFDVGGNVNVVDIKQYNVNGRNYRFVEIAQKNFNKIELYRQADDGKYYGQLLYRQVPRYTPKFTSPMVNDLNQLYAYEPASKIELLNAVINRKKPFASIGYFESNYKQGEIETQIAGYISECEKYDLDYSVQRIDDGIGSDRIMFEFCQKGTFGELFDIDSLIEDYTDNEMDSDYIDKLDKLRNVELSYFLHNEWDNGLSDTGLLLGISPKFTMSLINMWTTYGLAKEYRYDEDVTIMTI